MVLKTMNILKKFYWQYLIIDEAHRIKNEKSKVGRISWKFSGFLRPLCKFSTKFLAVRNGTLLKIQTSFTSHRHAPPEQPARTLGAAQLSIAEHLFERRRFRLVVSRSHDAEQQRSRRSTPQSAPTILVTTYQIRCGEIAAAKEGIENLRWAIETATRMVHEGSHEGHRHIEQHNGESREDAPDEFADAFAQVLQPSVSVRRR